MGQHGRLVHRRWISKETISDAPLLQSAELGPVIDTVSMCDVVAALRPVPIGKYGVTVVALSALIPMVPVIGIQVH